MCGMTRAEDIAHACSLGVDAIGLVFHPKSARNITVKKASELLKDLPPFVAAIAVLVNPEKVLVEELLNELPLQSLQFHGDESFEFCQQFNKPFIKAIHAEDAAVIMHSMDEFNKAQALLLDAASHKAYGGTGISFDWHIIPKQLPKPYILAGGLNEFNVRDALQVCRPYAVDVCSGIEAMPGVKDHSKMTRFIKALWGNE
jgi:phosphoribosylanthranilate isomerase